MTVAVPVAHPDGATHRLLIATALNKTATGKLNCTSSIVLTAGAATTTVVDARISNLTATILVPVTLDAAAEVASGNLFCVPTFGQVVINHTNSVNANRFFILSLLG